VEFIESPVFTKLLHEYLTDQQYRALQLFLADAPEAGALMPGTGGFRKVRWTDPRRSKGKRGGLRVIYYYFSEDLQIWFLTIYDKDEAEDLTPDQKRMLKAAIDREKQERAHATRRRR
jgi:mRNA-degrading endonuclease RelE of RelBE toxin-antitoxin system